MEELLKYFQSIYPMSSGLQTFLFEKLSSKDFSRKDFLLKEGRVASNIFFIEKGLLRCFYRKGSVEVSTWFMKEGDLCVSVESFFRQKKSYENIQALEDGRVLYMPYQDVQLMYRSFPEANFIGRVLTEHYYTLSEQRLYALRLQKSRDRYACLMENFPELIQRVPSKYLASYLGISEETVSRIRSRRLIN